MQAEPHSLSWEIAINFQTQSTPWNCNKTGCVSVSNAIYLQATQGAKNRIVYLNFTTHTIQYVTSQKQASEEKRQYTTPQELKPIRQPIAHSAVDGLCEILLWCAELSQQLTAVDGWVSRGAWGPLWKKRFPLTQRHQLREEKKNKVIASLTIKLAACLSF